MFRSRPQPQRRGSTADYTRLLTTPALYRPNKKKTGIVAGIARGNRSLREREKEPEPLGQAGGNESDDSGEVSLSSPIFYFPSVLAGAPGVRVVGIPPSPAAPLCFSSFSFLFSFPSALYGA